MPMLKVGLTPPVETNRSRDGSAMLGGIAQLIAPAEAFVRWWVGELTALVPARLRFASDRSERLVLLVGKTETEASLESPRNVVALGPIRLDKSADEHGELQALVPGGRLRRALSKGRLGVVLRIPADQALRITLELPAASEGNLHEVAGYELDRRTPFTADQVRFACRVLRRDAAAHRIFVELTIAPLAVIQDALRVASKLGIEPIRIDVAGANPGEPPSADLIASDDAGVSVRHASKLTFSLAAMAIVLAFVAIALPIRAMQQRADTLESEFASAKKTATTVGSLQKEIDTLREDEVFLRERKRKTPAASRLLFEMTHVLPDDTWLNEFQISGSEVQIIGFTASASALIGLLERSRIFRNTTFRSPVTRDIKTERERFHIAARVVQEGDQ
jgi:general secretion pathway protein L